MKKKLSKKKRLPASVQKGPVKYNALVKPSTGLPLTTRVSQFHSAHLCTIADSADKIVGINNAYMPYLSPVTNQGYRMDQFATLYQRVFVGSARYSLSVYGTSGESDTAGAVVAIPTLDANSMGATALDQLVVRPSAQAAYLVGSDYMNIVIQNPVLTGSISVKDYCQYKDWKDSKELTTATTTSFGGDGGLTSVYLHLINKTGQSLYCVVDLWQDAIFYEPVNEAAS